MFRKDTGFLVYKFFQSENGIVLLHIWNRILFPAPFYDNPHFTFHSSENNNASQGSQMGRVFSRMLVENSISTVPRSGGNGCSMAPCLIITENCLKVSGKCIREPKVGRTRLGNFHRRIW